jgi:hypothetical protein
MCTEERFSQTSNKNTKKRKKTAGVCQFFFAPRLFRWFVFGRFGALVGRVHGCAAFLFRQ